MKPLHDIHISISLRKLITRPITFAAIDWGSKSYFSYVNTLTWTWY